jgi:hypothetical protein
LMVKIAIVIESVSLLPHNDYIIQC